MHANEYGLRQSCREAGAAPNNPLCNDHPVAGSPSLLITTGVGGRWSVVSVSGDEYCLACRDASESRQAIEPAASPRYRDEQFHTCINCTRLAVLRPRSLFPPGSFRR